MIRPAMNSWQKPKFAATERSNSPAIRGRRIASANRSVGA
jgi:hypothetical protein